jgi:uncharacterized protein YeaO (DUF488 family)
MIRIKRVYEPKARADGRRFLVERLWPRGLPKEALAADAWMKDVAPTTELRKWFAHRIERWAGFRRRYEAELKARPEAWAPLLDAATRSTVTLLYSARDCDHNGAVVLREFLMRRAGRHRASSARATTPSAPRQGSRRERGTTNARDASDADLDRALADTFPASDPIARQVPSTIVRC